VIGALRGLISSQIRAFRRFTAISRQIHAFFQAHPFECVFRSIEGMTEQHTSFATFIVRLSRDDEGQVHGIVERASTGLKRPVEDVANVGSVIAVMLNAEAEERRA
jgi:hypothetical protein